MGFKKIKKLLTFLIQKDNVKIRKIVTNAENGEKEEYDVSDFSESSATRNNCTSVDSTVFEELQKASLITPFVSKEQGIQVTNNEAPVDTPLDLQVYIDNNRFGHLELNERHMKDCEIDTIYEDNYYIRNNIYQLNNLSTMKECNLQVIEMDQNNVPQASFELEVLKKNGLQTELRPFTPVNFGNNEPPPILNTNNNNESSVYKKRTFNAILSKKVHCDDIFAYRPRPNKSYKIIQSRKHFRKRRSRREKIINQNNEDDESEFLSERVYYTVEEDIIEKVNNFDYPYHDHSAGDYCNNEPDFNGVEFKEYCYFRYYINGYDKDNSSD